MSRDEAAAGETPGVGRPSPGVVDPGVRRSAESPISRREFVAGSAALVVASALAVAGCGAGEGTVSPATSGPPRWVRVATGDLKPGEPRWVEFDVPDAAASVPASPITPAGTPADSLPPSRGAGWIVLQPDSTLVAFAPRCTHRACLYDWDSGAQEFKCRCHPGLFAIDGKVLGGPPPRPLRRLATRPAGAGSFEIGWVDQA